MAWQLVGNIKGPAGPALNIQGSLADVSLLPASASPGDAYIIEGMLHVWNGTDWAVMSFEGAVGAAGEPGSPGAPGTQIYTGATVPSDGFGADGDYYIHSVTRDLYRKSSGTWSVVTSLGGGGSVEGVVLGPATSTLNAVARWSDATGELLKDSGVTISDSGGLLASDIGANTVSAYTAPSSAAHLTRKDYVDALMVGRVLGPTTSIDNQLVRMDGTTGAIQGSTVLVSDAGAFTDASNPISLNSADSRFDAVRSGSLLVTRDGAGSSNSLISAYNSAATLSSDDPVFSVLGNGSVEIAGASYAQVRLSGAAGSEKALVFRTAGVSRWTMGATPAAEAGSDAGSDFSVARYSDAGAWIDNPMAINRASGEVSLKNLYMSDAAAPYIDRVFDLRLQVSSSDPSTNSRLHLHAKTVAGRALPKVLDPDGAKYALQSALFDKQFFMMTPNSTTSALYMGSAGTSAGTLSTVAPATVGSALFPLATNYSTGASTNANGGVRMSNPAFRHSGLGGFFMVAVFGLPDSSYDGSGAGTGARVFVGMSAATNMVAEDDTTGAYVGLARHNVIGGNTHTNWQIISKRDTTQTQATTALPFIPQNVYQVILYSKSGVSGTVWWQITNLTTGASDSGTCVSTLPSSQANIGPVVQVGTVDAVARNIRISRVWCESAVLV